MISDRFRVSAGAAKKCFALAAFSAALALPAFGEIPKTFYYDGGVNRPTLIQYKYNWGHNIYEDQEMHFGTKSPQNDGTARVIFTKEHEGTVVIYRDVNPYDVIVESGNYVFEPLGWNDVAWTSKDGTITGSGSLTVNAGASLTMYIDNSYTGNTIVAGTLSTDVHPDYEDSDYGSGHHAFGTGALRVESKGTVNLNGTVQGNGAVEIAGTLNLGENRSGAAAAYNPFTSAENVTLVSGGTLNLGGNDDVVLGANNETALTVQGGTIANGTLDAVVDIALAEGTGLTLDGATLSQTVTDLELSAGNTISLENGASMSVNGLTVTVDSLENAAITLNGNSSLTVGGTLQVNIEESLLKQLIEDSAGGTASLPIFSVADSDGDVDVSEILSGFDSIKFNNGSQWVGTLDPTTGGIIISAVPEPAFIGLFFGALVLLHSTRRRRHSSSAAKV